MPDIHHLFVYGTLAPNRSNSHWLTNIGGQFTAGRIRGTLIPMGWGATQGYPAVILDDAGAWIEGFLFSSPHLSEHWQALDDFEGDGYTRQLVTVECDDGGCMTAWVYALSVNDDDKMALLEQYRQS